MCSNISRDVTSRTGLGQRANFNERLPFQKESTDYGPMVRLTRDARILSASAPKLLSSVPFGDFASLHYYTTSSTVCVLSIYSVSPHRPYLAKNV